MTSSVFTTLTIASVFLSSSAYEIGGEQTCLVFWFAGSFFVGQQIIGGFGITIFRFISLIHCAKFLRIGAMILVKAILVYQSIFYGGKLEIVMNEFRKLMSAIFFSSISHTICKCPGA